MDQYYMTMAQNLAQYSTCLRRKVAAVLVTADETHVVTAINNPFLDHTACVKNGCLREQMGLPSASQSEICRCIHAETSVVLQCARQGISTDNATVYTTLYPCSMCAKALIAAGIRRVVYSEDYPDTRAKKLFSQAQIQIVQL